MIIPSFHFLGHTPCSSAQRTGRRQAWQEAVPGPEEGAGEAHQGERGAQGEAKGHLFYRHVQHSAADPGLHG